MAKKPSPLKRPCCGAIDFMNQMYDTPFTFPHRNGCVGKRKKNVRHHPIHVEGLQKELI